jgi:hypothetical protein
LVARFDQALKIKAPDLNMLGAVDVLLGELIFEGKPAK